MSFYYAEKIITEFGSSQGLTINLKNGAVCFQQENGDIWYIEITNDGNFLLLHHNLSEISKIDSAYMNQLMELNANYEFMQGAWFGLHQATQSCRIFKILQTNALTANLMQEYLKDFIHLTGEIKKHFPSNLI